MEQNTDGSSLRASTDGLSKSWQVVKKHMPIYSGGKMQLSTDENMLACMYGDNVSFVDMETGLLLRRLHDENDETAETITCFALHPNGKELVTASSNEQLRQWEVESRQCLRSFRAHNFPIQTMAYDPTGTFVGTGSSNTSVRVFDLVQGYCTHVFRGHSGRVSHVQFHPDAKRLHLFSCSEDSTVRVWSLHENACIATFTSHLSTPTSLSLSHDGNVLVSAARDNVIAFYDLVERKVVKTVPTFENGEAVVLFPEEVSRQILGLKHPKKGTCALLVGGGGMRLKLYKCNLEVPRTKEWDVAHVRDIPVLDNTEFYASNGPPSTNPYITHIEWLRDQSLVLVTTSDHNFLLLNIPSFLCCRHIVGFNDDILDVKLVPTITTSDPTQQDKEHSVPPEQQTYNSVVLATNSNQIRLFSLDKFDCRTLDAHTDIVLAVDASSDGRWIFSSSKDRTCRVWSTTTWSCVAVAVGHADAVGAVCASKRQSSFLSHGAFFVSGSMDKTLKRWPLDMKVLESHVTRIEANGPASGRECLDLACSVSVRAHDKDINTVAVAPNDTLLASGSQDKTIKLWKTADLSIVASLKGHKRGVWKVEFSPTDKCLCSCSGDRTVKLWSVIDFSCLKTFQGHTGSVLSVQFVNQGMQLLSSSSDGLIKLWTLRSDECVCTLDAHSDKVWALASPQTGPGGMFVSGGGDSTLCIWEDVTAQVQEEALKQAESRTLREQELYNCVTSRQYQQALRLAMELNHSSRVLAILREVIEGSGSSTDEQHYILEGSQSAEIEALARPNPLDLYVAEWSDEELFKVLTCTRDWNTSARNCFIAQMLLQSVFRLVPHDRLTLLPNCLDIVTALLAYTQRHFDRLDRLHQASYIADITLSRMKLVESMLAEGINTRNVHNMSMPISTHARAALTVDDSEPPLMIPFDDDADLDDDQPSRSRPTKKRRTGTSGQAVKDTTQHRLPTVGGDHIDELEDYIQAPGREKMRSGDESSDGEEVVLYPEQVMLTDTVEQNHSRIRLAHVDATSRLNGVDTVDWDEADSRATSKKKHLVMKRPKGLRRLHGKPRPRQPRP